MLVPAIIPEIEKSPIPPNVNPAVLVIPPLIVKVFVPEAMSVLILDAAATVIVPDKVAAEAPVINLIAPVLLIPVPLTVMASGIVNVDAPLISIAALAPTNVPWDPDAVPNASLFFIWTVPAVIEVVPAYVLAELNINLPAPSLVKLLVELLVPPITLVIDISPAPPNVKPPVFEMAPVNVKV